MTNVAILCIHLIFNCPILLDGLGVDVQNGNPISSQNEWSEDVDVISKTSSSSYKEIDELHDSSDSNSTFFRFKEKHKKRSDKKCGPKTCRPGFRCVKKCSSKCTKRITARFPTCESEGKCYGLPDPYPCNGIHDRPNCGNLTGYEARVTRCYCPGNETCSQNRGYQDADTYCGNIPTCPSEGQCRDIGDYNDLCKCPGKQGCVSYTNGKRYCARIPPCNPADKCRHFLDEICRCPQGTICRHVNNEYSVYGKDKFCLKPACGDAIPRKECCPFNGVCKTKRSGKLCTCPGKQKCANETYSAETFCCDDGKGCGSLPETTPKICRSLTDDFYCFNAGCNWFKSDQNRGKIKAKTCYPTCKIFKEKVECLKYINLGCYWKNELEECVMNCRKIDEPKQDSGLGVDCKNAGCRFFRSLFYNNSFGGFKRNECHAKCATWLTAEECNQSPVCSWRGGKCLIQCMAVLNNLGCDNNFGCAYVDGYCVPMCTDISAQECNQLMGCTWATEFNSCINDCRFLPRKVTTIACKPS